MYGNTNRPADTWSDTKSNFSYQGLHMPTTPNKIPDPIKPSTPVYVPSTPVNVPSTPVNVPSTPVNVP